MDAKGTWSWEHNTNVSYGTMVFETEAQAKTLESFLKGDQERLASGGTRLEWAVVAEVIGAAGGDAAHKLDGPALWKHLRDRT